MDIRVMHGVPPILLEALETRWPGAVTLADADAHARRLTADAPDAMVMFAGSAHTLALVQALHRRRPDVRLALVVAPGVSPGRFAAEAGATVELFVQPVDPDVFGRRLGRLVASDTPPRLKLSRGLVDLSTGETEIDGHSDDLTGLERRLLILLARDMGRVFSPIELLENVWGYDRTTRTRVVPTAVYRLRKKIDTEPPTHLVTERGRGYRLSAEVLAPAAAASVSIPDGRTPYARFIGREAIRARIIERLARDRICVLFGPPGVGKSRLASEVARLWHGAAATQRWVSRIETTGADLGEQLDYFVAASRPDRAPTARGSALTRLVLIDLRAIGDAAAADLVGWVRADARMHALAVCTEHPPESIDRPIAVGPLDRDESVQLLLHRVRAVAPSIGAHTPVIDALSTLARASAGLPSALEFFARLCRFSAPTDLAHRFDLAAELLPDPHDASSISMESSLTGFITIVDDLPERLADVMRDISVFIGPFDVAAAQAVTGFDDIGRALEALHRRSILQRSTAPDGSARYAVLEPFRRILRHHSGHARRRRALLSRHQRICLREGRLLAERPAVDRGPVEHRAISPADLCAAFAYSLTQRLGSAEALAGLIEALVPPAMAREIWRPLLARAHALFPDLRIP